MKLLSWIAFLAFFASAAVSALAQMGAPLATQNAEPAPLERKVLFCEIRGTIDPASASYLRTCIRQASQNDNEALVVELDTPGGLVSSVKDMAQAIETSKTPVVVFVTPGGASATSAGALLTLAAHFAAMAPGTHIGAAHPVDQEGKDIQGAMGEKALNDTAAFARGLAELRGRNRDLAQAVVQKSKSLTAQEALDQGLIDILAVDRADLMRRMDGRSIRISPTLSHVIRSQGATTAARDMTWGQKVLHWLANPNIATLLMGIGVLALYVELTNPGVVVPGVVGGICLLTSFVAFQTLPIRLGGFLLLLLGIGLLVAEPFVVSHGALAAGGIVSFLLGVLWVMDPAESDLRISMAVWLPVVLTLAIGVLAISVAAARVKTLVRRALKEMKGGGSFGLAGYQGRIECTAPDGRSGKALIRGEIWDFSSTEPLRAGDAIEVTSLEGMKVVVKRV